MKILMVRPRPSPETIGLQHLMIVEPLELEILCALKRRSDKVVIVDMILEKRSFESFVLEHHPDILCVTGYITNVSTMLDYCKSAKKILNNIKTIVGGVHCEVCPGDFENESVDFRVVRNAARIFTALLDHIDNKRHLPPGVYVKGNTLENNILPPFEFNIPFPDRDSVAKYRKHYFYIFQKKVALIKTSFGCPYTCSFCFCTVITAKQYFRRPLSEVMQELEQINEKEIYIVDDDFLVDQKWLNDFISELDRRKINKHFLVYGRADFIATHPDTIHDFAQVGLRTVIVGFESFSDNELDAYHKNTSAEMYKQTMRVLQNNKIDCFATIIIPPEWDKSDFANMVKAVKILGIHFVNLQPLTPLPKTGIRFPEEQLIIPRSEYEKWDLAHVTVRPTKLSVSEFYTEILRAYNSILYSPKVIFKYISSYNPAMLYKMLAGGYKVSKQYRLKIKEARQHA